MVSLFIALFFPDLFGILRVPTNIELDIILSVVMCVFAFELFGLSATDPSYLLSFFFFMDIVGTVSMIFDISFLLGVKADMPVIMETDIDAKADVRDNAIV